MYFQNMNSDTNDLLFRVNLINKIKKSIDYPLTTIIAGAGYGKSVSVNIALQQFSHKVIWQQLTLIDNNTTRYWLNFKKNLSEMGGSLAKKIINVPFPDTSKKIDAFILLLAEELGQEDQYTIVYDDFHIMYDKSFLYFIERLVNAQIPKVSIIILSRSNLPINTLLLMSKGLLLEVNEMDLKFTEREALEYFDNQNIHLSELAQKEIYKQSGGWIFALYLISLSLKQKPLSDDYAIVSMKLNIHKLIENEIFLPLNDEIKVFLVKLSLLDNFPAGLLSCIADENIEILQQIDNITTFIRLDVFTNTYYIHHLFLEFLSERVDALTNNEKKDVYLKTANWYLTNNYKFDAISYYEKAEEYHKMTLVMASFPIKVSTNIADNFINILERTIPIMGVEKYLAKIIKVRFSFDIQEAKSVLEEIKSLKQFNKKNYLLLCIYGVIGYNIMTQYGEGYLDYFKLAIETNEKMLLKAVYSLKSYACIRNPQQFNRFDVYFNELDASNSYSSGLFQHIGSGLTELCKAEYAYFQRDFKSVIINTNISQIEASKEGEFYIEDLALFYNFRVKLAQGKYEEIKSIIEKLKLQIEKYQYPDYYTIYTVASDWFNIIVGNTYKCKIWNTRKTLDVENMTSTDAVGCFQLVIARCYLAEKMYKELYVYLCSLETESITKDFLFGKLEVTCLKAITLYKLDKKDDAVKNLEEAYDFAVYNNFIMPFAELGNDMVALIKYIIKSSQKDCISKIPIEWLSDIQKKAAAYQKQISFVIKEYKKENESENNLINLLTKKELECFINISKGLSRSQIATNLNLTENYIKIMTQNIYLKLGINSVKDAIHIATINKLI